MISLQKLQSLLRVLGLAERERFLLFLASPYHNTNTRLLPLAQMLFELVDQNEVLRLEPSSLYQCLYPQEAEVKMQRIYDHLSFLRRLVERFYAIEQLLAQPVQESVLQLQYLTDADAWDSHRLLQKKGVARSETHLQQDSESHLSRFRLLQQANYAFLALGERRFDASLNQMDEELSLFFLAQKLRNACEMFNRGNVVQGDYSPTMLPEIMQFLGEKPSYLQYPAIAVYHQLLRCYEVEDRASFAHFRSLIREHAKAFGKIELGGLYDYAQNICVKKINQGDSSYLQLYFELFQEMLAQDLMLEAGVLDHRLYKNIVTVGIRLREYVWVEEFIHGFAERLSPAFREAAYHYNLAAYYHAIKDYRNAQRQLWKVDIEDVYYQLGARTLLLKIYFGLEDEEGLEAQVRAFRAYLKRNRKVSPYQTRAHAGLIRYTQRLSRLRGKRSSLSLKQFRHEIGKMEADVRALSPVSNRDWLLSQMKELD
ncbi:MAG: hypothetical protein AAFQ68_20280 [Bacteroidota bacterium]